MLRSLILVVALAVFSMPGDWPHAERRPPHRIHHCVFFGLESARTTDSAFLAIPSIEAAQLKSVTGEFSATAGPSSGANRVKR